MTYSPVYMFYNLSLSVESFTFDNLSINDGTFSSFDRDTAEALGHAFTDAIFSELVLFVQHASCSCAAAVEVMLTISTRRVVCMN